ncbi:hypothetical protein B0T20DRAFT_508042 [Sordaria brevicollis]|uniref:Uncharacterized protein n=1 Tax=Sordaria brevicollis TaxID=83679 RepID=A0AAE0UA93_SORBR|nr:hypothetical protein B0T20DRAFT_508042 [Sordaria brevicollis]
MAPPSRRFGKPPTTRRYLAFRQHKQRELTIQRELNGERVEEDEVSKPGSKKIISFRRPGLVGGTYTIQVQQTISEDRPEEDKQQEEHPEETISTTYDPSKTLNTAPVKQQFEVLSPQFDLPADSVYSVYPEQGHEATNDTLPHIVLNDSTLPWERIGSQEAEDSHPDDYARNRVPWMALMIFSPDELRLDDAEKAGIFAHTSLKDQPPKQLESMSVRVPMGDLAKLKDGTARVPFGHFDIGQATKPDTNVIFPRAALFNHLFAAYNDVGEPLPGGPDISRHRFLAHVVRMNTTGMANADSDDVNTTREFSVVVANRLGPLDGEKASQMLVHLVSLENIESLKPFPLTKTVPGSSPEQPARVGLVSLYSWSYTCLPPNSLNVKQAFENIARTSSMLKPIIPPQSENLDDVSKRMLSRLEDGYTLVRSITPTGETTAALFRGPLTPSIVEPLNWNLLSNTGSDLNIFDKELGMMDITFSSAWSLGRTLALADRAFTISLTRVRHQILHSATSTARRKMLQATQRQSYKREDLVRSLDNLISETVAISQSTDKTRWFQPASASPPDLSYASISPFVDSAMKEAAFEVAKSLLAGDSGQDGWKATWDKDTPPYDEHNEPFSPDWMIVLRFVLDLYYLVNVPSHYLMPDQSLVPRESLRFFFVDHNWIDAVVDGALSLGNQGGPGLAKKKEHETDDIVRKAVKETINRLFTDPACHPPAIPRYGFYLRSAVAAQFPDLKVSVEVTGAPSGNPYLLRHDVIDKETMLGFFSDAPLKDGLHGLRFELPAHQQYFSLGTVTNEGLEVAYKRQYTKAGVEDDQRNIPVATIHWPSKGKGRSESSDDGRERSQVLVRGSDSGSNDVRLVLVEKLAADVHTTLLERMAKLGDNNSTFDWYNDTTATSAMMAYQLSSPSWQLQIGQMKANAFTAAETKAMVERISGCLSYREASSPSLARTLDANTLLPAKTPQSIPDNCRPAIQREAARLPPHALLRVRYLDSSISAAPPSSPSQSLSSLSSWEDIPRATLSGSPIPDDSDSDGFELIPRPRIPLPWEPTPVDPRVGLPEFEYHVSTTRSPAVKKIPILEAKQDLIFSIVYSAKGEFFRLTKLTIDIPLISENGQGEMLENKVPADAHVHMVSNLRFNARMRYSDKDKNLQIEIKPRSQKGREEGVSLTDWIGRWKHQEGVGEENSWAARTELSVVLYNVPQSPTRISLTHTHATPIMCRQILFSGTCPQCTEHFIWQDLSQELSCLEAKNTGVFGQCAFGVQTEEHRFDQECEPCAADNERDEGYCADEDGGRRKKQRVA